MSVATMMARGPTVPSQETDSMRLIEKNGVHHLVSGAHRMRSRKVSGRESIRSVTSANSKGGLTDIDQEALERIRQLRITGPRRSLTQDLDFMAQYKYNSYEVYTPVKRFLPCLLEWLSQFQTPAEKETALEIVGKLVFLSRRELLELSDVTFQKILYRILNEIVAIHHLRPFDYSNAYRRLNEFVKKQCVFVAMSDGAQIDYFRRHASGVIENDRVLTYYKLDREEIAKLSKAKYAFLIDDMCASGTTFLGKQKNNGPIMDGQLFRFLTSWGRQVKFKAIFYCPYVITEKAHNRITNVSKSRRIHISGVPKFDFDVISGMSIPSTYSILEGNNELFTERQRRRVISLCRKYYDKRVENDATRKGGGCKYGFGKVGIFLVRYNNTPNNTPSVIWFSGGTRRSLFRRLVRHFR